MDMATQVQIFYDAVCISLSPNTSKKGIYLTILPPINSRVDQAL